jgi:hypothetical protein
MKTLGVWNAVKHIGRMSVLITPANNKSTNLDCFSSFCQRCFAQGIPEKAIKSLSIRN